MGGLEKYYGAAPLANARRAPVEVREDGCGQLLEALGCIYARPRGELVQSGGGAAGALSGGKLMLKRPADAVGALAAHAYACVASSAAACARAAVARLRRREWLAAWEAAAEGGVTEEAAEAATNKLREVGWAGPGRG
jgi:hypothetical protein